jgi:hypothetical protein
MIVIYIHTKFTVGTHAGQLIINPYIYRPGRRCDTPERLLSKGIRRVSLAFQYTIRYTNLYRRAALNETRKYIIAHPSVRSNLPVLLADVGVETAWRDGRIGGYLLLRSGPPGAV